MSKDKLDKFLESQPCLDFIETFDPLEKRVEVSLKNIRDGVNDHSCEIQHCEYCLREVTMLLLIQDLSK